MQVPGAEPAPSEAHTVAARSTNPRDPSECPADRLEIKHVRSDGDTEIILMATFTEHLLCASPCGRGGVVLITAWSRLLRPPGPAADSSPHFTERETEGCRGEAAAWLHSRGAGPRVSNSRCLPPLWEDGKEHWTGSARVRDLGIASRSPLTVPLGASLNIVLPTPSEDSLTGRPGR